MKSLSGACAFACMLALLGLACGPSGSGADAPTDGGALPDAAVVDGGGASDANADATGNADAAEDAPVDASLDAGAPSFASPGPHPVTTRDATIGSTSVHLVYPTDAPPPAGFDGVAFAHGFQLKTNGYDALLTHLASWGYVVVSTDYPGTLFSIDHNDVAKALTAARTAMASGTITGLPKVDATKIAAAGHSLGGKGAVMAVLADPAFAAALTLDPVDGNPGNPLGSTTDATHPQLNPTAVAQLAVPIAYFGATQSHCGSNACAPTGLDAAEFFKNTPATVPHYLFTVLDFGHMQFLDDPSCGFVCSACASGNGAIDPRRAAIRATAIAFLRRHLDGDASASTWLDGSTLANTIAAGIFWDGSRPRPPC
jgi:hypothetical protein